MAELAAYTAVVHAHLHRVLLVSLQGVVDVRRPPAHQHVSVERQGPQRRVVLQALRQDVCGRYRDAVVAQVQIGQCGLPFGKSASELCHWLALAKRVPAQVQPLQARIIPQATSDGARSLPSQHVA